MASADQLLFQQANQTMALMQAIGQNTQRAFQNRERVQQAQLTAGLQVASQLEQNRVNDTKIAVMKQEMDIRQQQFEWEKKNEEFKDRLRPLEFQLRELDAQNKFRSFAEQRMSPFLSDIKGEFQQLIIDNPEFAGEAQSIYAQTIDGILNRSISDPSIDMSAEIEKSKGQLRSWMKSKTKPDMMPVLKSFGIAATNTVLGTAFDPTKPIKEAEKKVNLDRDDVSRAATIYAGFGGNPKDFVLRYDPDEKARVDTAYRTSMAIGDLPPIEILERMPQEMQTSLLKRAEQKQNINNLNDAAKSITAQITEFAKQDRALREATQPAANESAIASLKTQLDFINKERAKAMGIDMLPSSGSQGVNADDDVSIEELKNRITQSVQLSTNTFTTQPLITDEGELPTDEQVAESQRRADQIRPYWMVSWLGGGDSAEEFKSMVATGSVDEEKVEKLISKATPQKILALTQDSEFNRFIRATGIAFTGKMSATSSGYSVPEKSVIGMALDTLDEKTKSTQREKSEAIKVLKSKLPSIILRYTTK